MSRRHETRKQRRRRRCPSGKIAYRDYTEAAAGKAAIEARGERTMTIYQCSLCQFWHLTTESILKADTKEQQ